MIKNFNTAIKERRTFYHISPHSKISNQQIEELLQDAILHAPSAFNSQSARVVMLLGKHHKRLWSIIMEELEKIISIEQREATKEKIDSFANGYGSILFFDDKAIIEGLQGNFPTYKDNFPIWAHQANGMLQYLIWTALVSVGFGASLQHYNPVVDNAIKEQWSIPESWQLIAQMPFGVPSQPPNEKSYLPVKERLMILKD